MYDCITIFLMQPEYTQNVYYFQVHLLNSLNSIIKPVLQRATFFLASILDKTFIFHSNVSMLWKLLSNFFFDFVAEIDLDTPCVVRMENNQTFLQPPPTPDKDR